jgi:hypothetical protein
MIDCNDDARISQLLAPLRRLEPLPMPLRPSKGRRRRLLLAAGIAAGILAVAGVSIAAGVGPFSDIGAAEHPRGPADAVDRATKEFLRRGLAGIVADSVRLVGRLPSGRRVYVARDTRGDLCVVIAQQGYSCGPDLTHARPITITTIRRDPRSKPVSYGVALNEVTAVSFKAGGKIVTVPVTHNVWAYEGQSSVLRWARVRFDNGKTKTLVRPRRP